MEPFSLCLSSLMSPVPLSFHSGGSFSDAKRYSLARLEEREGSTLTGAPLKKKKKEKKEEEKRTSLSERRVNLHFEEFLLVLL